MGIYASAVALWFTTVALFLYRHLDPRLVRRSQSGNEHDLAAGVTPREILIGLAYIGQMIDLGDRDLQSTSVDQAGEFSKHLAFAAALLPSVLTPCFADAAKSMIVSIRSGATPSSSARST